MENLTQPDVVITHESDLDGLVSGVLLQMLSRHLYGNRVRLEAYQQLNWRQRPMTEGVAWVSDLGFDKRLDRHGWFIVDHHTNTVTPQKARLVHDPKKSASLLVYECCQENGLFSDELDRLVHITNVADLFLDQDPDFLLANDYANLVKSYHFWNLYNLIDGKLERLLDHPLLRVMTAKREIEDPIGLGWSRQRMEEITPQIGLVNTSVGNVNLIIHQLLREEKVPYATLMTLLRKSNGMVVVSLRSRNGEALRVAERLQGGGHPNACGATLPKSVHTITDAINYLKQALNPQYVDHSEEASLEKLLDM